MMPDKDLPRLYVTIGLFILFGFVLWENSDNQMLIGAIIGSFGTAITFWLGSSKGSSDKSTTISGIAEQPSSGPDGTREDPIVVEGAGPEAEAVPTTTKKPDK